MLSQRRAGVLLHITSLPSDFGVGDLGKGAYEFVDFLSKAGQTLWQILPINPTTIILEILLTIHYPHLQEIIFS